MGNNLIWQESNNSEWKSNYRIECDICGCKPDRVMQFSCNKEIVNACFVFTGRKKYSRKKGESCLQALTSMVFGKYPDADFVHARSIEYFKLRMGRGPKREPIGLSKRYNVMKRDGFVCVLCGKSGKQSLLEIDHIMPVSSGGNDSMANLRTLCFECNRGKGAQL